MLQYLTKQVLKACGEVNKWFNAIKKSQSLLQVNANKVAFTIIGEH